MSKKFSQYSNQAIPEDGAKLLYENNGETNSFNQTYLQLKADILNKVVTSNQGPWNASTNTPTLTSSTGTKGHYYIVSVAGNTNLNGITDWEIGDWAIFDGASWQKIDNSSVVSSVFGRTGTVISTNGDYTGSQVTNVISGNISSTTVQAAINELDTEKQQSDPGLTSIAGLTTGQNKMIYTTASDVYTTTDLSNFGRSFINVTDEPSGRLTLGLGTMATQNASSVAITGGTIGNLTGMSVTVNNAGAELGGAVVNANQSGSGDSLFTWLVPGRRWYAGIDNSDADTWKLATTAGAPGFATDTVLSATVAGRIGIGTSTPTLGRLTIDGIGTQSALHLTGFTAGGGWGMVFQPITADNLEQVRFNNVAGVQVGSISETATSTAYNETSDHRLKYNVSDMNEAGAITRILNSRPVDYQWNSNDENDRGFIAHELHDAGFEKAVYGVKNGVNDDGSIRPQGIDTGKMIPDIVKVIQYLYNNMTLK